MRLEEFPDRAYARQCQLLLRREQPQMPFRNVDGGIGRQPPKNRNIQPSRLCDGTPAAISCKPGSIKSGPTLNGCTAKPRFRSVSRSPKVTVVLPEPVMGAEMTHPFMMLE